LHNRIFASSRISAIRERCFAAFGSNHPEPRCFSWRLWVAHDPANNSLAIAQIEIVITAATVLVGANKGERSGDSHATRSEKGSFFEMYTRLRLLVPGPIQILRVPHSRSKSDKNTLTRHWRYDRSLDTVSCSHALNHLQPEIVIRPHFADRRTINLQRFDLLGEIGGMSVDVDYVANVQRGTGLEPHGRD
jgi:hypothetical protein